MNLDIKGIKNITLPPALSQKYGDVDGLSLQNLFYTKYDCFPGCYLFDYDSRTTSDYRFDTMEMAKHFQKSIPADEEMEFAPYFTRKLLADNEYEDNLGFCIILNKSRIMARIERYVNDSYVLFPNDELDAAKNFINQVTMYFIPPKEQTRLYWRIAASQSGYYLEKGRVKPPQGFDVKKLYNDDFVKEDEKIKKFIEAEETSGLVILHGEKGTGKSTYIKDLIATHPKKKFIYIPANLVSLLGDPSFGSFVSTLNNDIIIIEDCENAIRDRKSNGSASAVSLLLNLTDGILADDLNMKFICTFNENMKNIDEALLRKGRLVCKHEFKGLVPEKANTLLEERGFKEKVTKPITLADIFHFGEDDYETSYKPII